MNPTTAQTLARLLIAEHLVGWTFGWDRGVRRIGACHWAPARKITLSYDLTVKVSEELIRDTILHEIAHALAGHRAGHGPDWVRTARSIGCTGDRCYDYNEVEPIEGKYVATCLGCGRVFYMHRMIKKHARRSCKKCGPVLGHLAFTER